MKKITENTDIENILMSFDSSVITADKVSGHYISKISMQTKYLSENDILMLSEFMRFKSDEYHVFYILLDQANNPIKFESESMARSMAMQIKSNLKKQFLFSIYRKTKIKILPKIKHSDNIPIKFIEIK